MILIVDDDPALSDALARLFTAEGLASRCWADAEAALAEIRARVPLVVVLDYRLPGMDGLRLLELLRTDAMLSRLPVVFYSATDNETVRAEARRLGATGWFPKVAGHHAMLATVLRIARRTAGPASFLSTN